MQKKIYIFVLFALATSVFSHAQEYRWKVGLDYFFDNTEYGKSSFTDSETMNGIWLSPMGSIVWNGSHSINAGVNLLKIPGMDKAIDKTEVTVYYQYETTAIRFRAGAFPRKEVLGNYNDFFFADSVNNFVPLMQGVFFQMGGERNFFNAWFDRTGYATPTRHEHFFVGMSGKISRGLWFADFQSYMYHYSNTRPASENEGVSENMQLQASTGLQYRTENGFEGLVSVGTLMGYERDRRFDDQRYKPIGFVARANAEFCGIGTQNTLYAGDARMRLADTFGGDLYWGTPFLRATSYLQSKWYIRLMESDWAQVRFNCNLHFSERHVLFQQTFSVSANIGNFSLQNSRKTVFPWMKMFE